MSFAIFPGLMLNKTRMFYMNSGVDYMVSSDSQGNADKYLFLCPRFGFSFYNSRNDNSSGISFDLGVAFSFWGSDRIYTRPPFRGRPTEYLDKADPTVIPSASLSYFFKLK
jgi:hypothetical protein